MFDCESVAFGIVIFQGWILLTYSDFIHIFEFDVDDAIKCTLSVRSHDDRIDECFLNLISLFQFVIALKFAVDGVNEVEHRLTSDNLTSRIHSQEHASFAFDEVRCEAFVHV